MLAGVLSTVYGYIDVSIMGNISSKIEVSYYGTVQTLKGILCFSLPILIQGLSPHLSAVHRDSEALYDRTRRSFVRYILGLVLCIGLGFIIFGRDILFYLYGSDFMPALIIIPFSAVTLFSII